MKAVILAGGLGTRLSEETALRPKPMVEIGGRPILWHVLKIYSAHGINDFIICGGYKAYVIKEYFANYCLHAADVRFDLGENTVEVCRRSSESWRVLVIDTGQDTMTGGRIKRVRQFLDNETFCCTYGDGLGDIDISTLIAHHRQSQLQATLTGVQPPGRFGALALEGHKVRAFQEKPAGDGSWINGGFFVFEPSIFDFIEGDATVLEAGPLPALARLGALGVFKHQGFWRPMDTLRDKYELENLWDAGTAPWKTW